MKRTIIRGRQKKTDPSKEKSSQEKPVSSNSKSEKTIKK